MIPLVKAGQSIGAKNQNLIIGAINQLYSGNHISKADNCGKMRNLDGYVLMFQTRCIKHNELAARPSTCLSSTSDSIMMFIGDYDEFLASHYASEAYLLKQEDEEGGEGRDERFGKIEKEWIREVNGKVGSSYDTWYDGWFDTCIPKYATIYGCLIERLKSRAPLEISAGLSSEEGEALHLSNYVIITTIADDGDLKEEFEKSHNCPLPEDDPDWKFKDEVQERVTICKWTEPGIWKFTNLSAASTAPEYQSHVQLHTGTIYGFYGNGLNVDTQLSGKQGGEINECYQCSIDKVKSDDAENPNEYLLIYNFNKEEVISKEDLSVDPQPDVILRYYDDEANDRTVQYVVLSTLIDYISDEISSSKTELSTISSIAEIVVSANIISGDSQHPETRLSSIHLDIDMNGHPYYKLWNFDQTIGEDQLTAGMILDQENFDDYYTNGKYQGKLIWYDQLTSGVDVVMRYVTDDGAKMLKYGRISADLPPFVHGDSDNYVNGDDKSLQFNKDNTDVTKSNYGLYGFHNNAARNQASGDEVLVRKRNGNNRTLEYVHLSSVVPAEEYFISADSNFDIITDIGYDVNTGYIQIKKREATVVDNKVRSIGPESGWIDKIATQAHNTGGV